jgi:hypothetical protein
VGGTCSANREKRTACRLLVGKQEEKRQLGRPRHGFVDKTKMDLVEIGWGGVDWILDSELFQIANGGLPCGSITVAIQHTDTPVTYKIHISNTYK